MDSGVHDGSNRFVTDVAKPDYSPSHTRDRCPGIQLACLADAYDDCINAADQLFIEGKINTATYLELTNGCCINSGGVLGPPPENLCGAPAANRVPPSNLPTETLTPAQATAPPGDITQTFAPAPEPKPGLLN